MTFVAGSEKYAVKPISAVAQAHGLTVDITEMTTKSRGIAYMIYPLNILLHRTYIYTHVYKQ